MSEDSPKKELKLTPVSYVDSLWVSYIVSVMAAWVAEFATYPLDLTKTRLQIQGELANKSDLKLATAPYRGMIGTAAGIAKEEGLPKLWQGMSAGLLRHVVYSGTRMVIYQTLRDDVFEKKPDEHFPMWKSAFCGITAGALAQYIGSPADLLKVQLQMEGKRRLMGLPVRVHGLGDAFAKIVKTSGYKGLWKVTYPLDLTKTRLQIQGELSNKVDKQAKSVPYRGMLKTAFGIAKEEGLSKLWVGMSAGLLRHVIYSGTRMVMFQFLRDEAFKKKPGEHFELWKSALCGITSGAFAQYIASPTDLLKVQLQMEGKRRMMGLPPRVNGLTDAFQKVWKVSGYKGLWKGSVPNMQRAALVNLGDLTTYDYAKRFILMNTSLKDNHFVHVMASFCAGFMAAGMGTPADVIKTRVMNQPMDNKGRGVLYKSSIDCLIKTTKAEGFAALYKGFFPIWLRMAPWSLTFWLSYEEVMVTIRTNNL